MTAKKRKNWRGKFPVLQTHHQDVNFILVVSLLKTNAGGKFLNGGNSARITQWLAISLRNWRLLPELYHEYLVKKGFPYSVIVSSFDSSQEGVKKVVFKQDKRNLSEIGSYRKKAIQILDEVNYDK